MSSDCSDVRVSAVRCVRRALCAVCVRCACVESRRDRLSLASGCAERLCRALVNCSRPRLEVEDVEVHRGGRVVEHFLNPPPDIADVTYFVPPDSHVDLEAAARGTTVYLSDRRIDMIPARLSSHILFRRFVVVVCSW